VQYYGLPGAAIGNPNAVLSREALEEKNANRMGVDGKSQDGSLGHSDNIHQLNEFNSRPPPTLPVFVLLEGFAF
jgi:hypothetical protein